MHKFGKTTTRFRQLSYLFGNWPPDLPVPSARHSQFTNQNGMHMAPPKAHAGWGDNPNIAMHAQVAGVRVCTLTYPHVLLRAFSSAKKQSFTLAYC
jgi:hypothetical protein